MATKKNSDANTPRQARHISHVLSKKTTPISGNIAMHNNLTIILLVLAKSRIARIEKPSNVLFCTKRANITTGITNPINIPNQTESNFCFITKYLTQDIKRFVSILRIVYKNQEPYTLSYQIAMAQR